MVGIDVAMPVAIAPTGLTGMQHADGEILAARAAEKFGIPFTLVDDEHLLDRGRRRAHQGAVLVPALHDARPRLHGAADRARAGGASCSALVLTLDLQILGQRHKDLKNGLTAPPKPTLANLLNLVTKPRWCLGMLGTKRRSFGNIVGHVKGVGDMSSLGAWTAEQFDPRAQLGRRRVGQEALGRQADPEGHPRRRGRAPRGRQRRRRDRRLQPRRPPARRRAVVDRGAAGDRRRGRLADRGLDGRRHPLAARTC